MNPDLQNTIPCEEAEKWTKAWRDKHPKACKAFLVPVVDLLEVLNEMGVLKDKVAEKAQKEACIKGLRIRAYGAIGSDDEGKEAEEKLLIVGTKYNRKTKIYHDIINEEIDGDNIKLNSFGDPIVSSGIYDFTSPCPNTCDDESPLNG